MFVERMNASSGQFAAILVRKEGRMLFLTETHCLVCILARNAQIYNSLSMKLFQDVTAQGRDTLSHPLQARSAFQDTYLVYYVMLTKVRPVA